MSSPSAGKALSVASQFDHKDDQDFMKNMIDYLDEIKVMIDNLRADFKAHDHGAAYTASAVRLGSSAGTFSGTAEQAAAMSDWAKYCKKS